MNVSDLEALAEFARRHGVRRLRLTNSCGECELEFGPQVQTLTPEAIEAFSAALAKDAPSEEAVLFHSAGGAMKPTTEDEPDGP